MSTSDGFASDSPASEVDYASDSSYADSDVDHDDISLSLTSSLLTESTLSMTTELSMQSLLVLETELEMLKDFYKIDGGFSWNLLGGCLVALARTATGVLVIVASGGTAAPAVVPALGSALSSAGVSGLIFCAGSSEQSFKWDAFVVNMGVSAGITLATMGAEKMVAVAKGLKTVKDLSETARALTTAAVVGTSAVVENSTEGRPWYDQLHLQIASCLTASFVGAKFGAQVDADKVEVTRKELFDLFVSEVARGAGAGAATSTMVNIATNVVVGRDVFDNFRQALAIGARNGAISGAVRGVTVSAQTLRNCAFHSQQLSMSKNAVANGEPLSAFHLAMYCENSGDAVFVLDTRDGKVYAYGDHTGPGTTHLLAYTPGSNGQAGHYDRLDPTTLQPIVMSSSGPNSCLADALGVSMAEITQALTIETQKLLVKRENLRALYAYNTGGAPNKKKLQLPSEEDLKRVKENVEKLAIDQAFKHDNKHMKKFRQSRFKGVASQFDFLPGKKGGFEDHWAWMAQFATAMEGQKMFTGTQVMTFDFNIGTSDGKVNTLVYDCDHGYPSVLPPKQTSSSKVPEMKREDFVKFMNKNLDVYEAYINNFQQESNLQKRSEMIKALTAFTNDFINNKKR